MYKRNPGFGRQGLAYLLIQVLIIRLGALMVEVERLRWCGNYTGNP